MKSPLTISFLQKKVLRVLELECPRNTGIPGRRPGRRIPRRLVGIVSSLEAKFSEKLFENRPGSTT